MRFHFIAALFLAMAAQAPAPPSVNVEAVAWPEGEQGNSHGVTELRLSSGHGAPLVLRDRDDGELIPITGSQFPIGPKHVLLLGWSSIGSGTLALHALLLHLTAEGVVLEHNLKLTMARSSGVMIVRRSGPDAVLLGIPDWSEASTWTEVSLLVGKGWRESSMREVPARKLRFVATEPQSTDTYYPAYQPAIAALILRDPAMRKRVDPRYPERVAWLSVTSAGMAWKARMR